MDKALDALGMNNNSFYQPEKTPAETAAPKLKPRPYVASTGESDPCSWMGKANPEAWPANDPGDVARSEVKRQRDKFE